MTADIGFVGVHHVGILCKDLDISLRFYCGVLGKDLFFFTEIWEAFFSFV